MKSNIVIYSLKYFIILLIFPTSIVAQKKFHHPRIKINTPNKQQTILKESNEEEPLKKINLNNSLFEEQWIEAINNNDNHNENLDAFNPQSIHPILDEQKLLPSHVHENINTKLFLGSIKPTVFYSLKQHRKLLIIEKSSKNIKTLAIIGVIIFLIGLGFLVLALVSIGNNWQFVLFIIFLLLFLLFAFIGTWLVLKSGL
ncbi:MAG: hypothetical protein N2167_07930 [Flavobacteriales bacterium]|nr:hypothetical protein [Flavobacteriales bacterium]